MGAFQVHRLLGHVSHDGHAHRLGQVILDGIITSTGEAETAEAALTWLIDPPPVRIELPEARRRAILKVSVRAIFSSGTKWLIFPTQNATPWMEISLEPLPEPADAN